MKVKTILTSKHFTAVITSHTIWGKIQTIDRQDKYKVDFFNVPDISGFKIVNNLYAVLSVFDQRMFQGSNNPIIGRMFL